MTTPTLNVKKGGYWTQEQVMASLKKNKLDVNDHSLKASYIKSSSYNLTSTFLETNPDVPAHLTGMIYKRFEGLLFGQTLQPSVYDDGTPILTIEGKPRSYISSMKFCSLFPKSIKGNKVQLKAAVMKNFKTEGLNIVI